MSFNHNTEADFAATELARMFVVDPALCYAAGQLPRGLSATASYEPSSSPWPKADGLVSLLEGGIQQQRDIAIEYKRQEEGIHGLLTAIGQAQAYIHKGYSGAALVLPSNYPTLNESASFVRNVLDTVGGAKAIGVFRYDQLDTTIPSPFFNRLHCVRPIQVGLQGTQIGSLSSRPKTQWVHMREGSTTRDAFFVSYKLLNGCLPLMKTRPRKYPENSGLLLYDLHQKKQLKIFCQTRWTAVSF